ncbi:MAG: hypothetical protein JSS46_06425 [Proteobacteria bacterium]|jgi:hypothetical protein|nr:hypothetical protein [Pseudomonadota bacterium]
MIEFAVLLAAIDDGTLGAFIVALDRLQGTMPALQAWLEHAARWESDRRSGFDYPLQPPMAAISPDELPAAVEASTVLGTTFRGERGTPAPAIADLFDRLRDTLAAEDERRTAQVH